MSVLFRRGGEEQRSDSYQSTWGSGRDPIRSTSVKGALRLIPVYSSTSLIADMLSASPWALFDNSGDSPVRTAAQPVMVTDPGTFNLDLFSWKHQAMTSVLLHGNAYGLIVATDNGGAPAKVQWLRPELVFIDESDPAVAAKFYYEGRLIPRTQLIHIPGYVLPGYVRGLSPIQNFRLQIETGMEAQSFGRRFFRRGTTPPGVLKNMAQTLDPIFAQETKARFVASTSSSEPFVTGKDWDYTPIAIPQGDAQFLIGIKATANQMASAFRVAPQDVGGSDDGSSLTYKNLEQDQIRFNVRTLRPWAVRFEEAFSRYFPPTRYLQFDLDAGVRADMITRYQAHQLGISAEFETRDEARRAENLPPLNAEDKADFDSIRKQATPAVVPKIGSAA